MAERRNPFYNRAVDQEAARLTAEKGARVGAAVRGHIVTLHFAPETLGWVGVPRFDVDVLERLGEDLDWVVKKGIGKLENGWDDPAQNLALQDPKYIQRSKEVYRRLQLPWGEDWCKQMIVKSLQYIDDKSSHTSVDWDKVFEVYPAARDIKLDINRDSHEPFMQGTTDIYVATAALSF